MQFKVKSEDTQGMNFRDILLPWRNIKKLDALVDHVLTAAVTDLRDAILKLGEKSKHLPITHVNGENFHILRLPLIEIARNALNVSSTSYKFEKCIFYV